eukprot:1188420-Prorocentrum_minimum.AAC.1
MPSRWGIYCLPSCDWFSCRVYTVSPRGIGSRDKHILPPLLRLVLLHGLPHTDPRPAARPRNGPANVCAFLLWVLFRLPGLGPAIRSERRIGPGGPHPCQLHPRHVRWSNQLLTVRLGWRYARRSLCSPGILVCGARRPLGCVVSDWWSLHVRFGLPAFTYTLRAFTYTLSAFTYTLVSVPLAPANGPLGLALYSPSHCATRSAQSIQVVH